MLPLPLIRSPVITDPNAFNEPELVAFPLIVELAMFCDALAGLPTQPPDRVAP
jgi:hypothetical protein